MASAIEALQNSGLRGRGIAATTEQVPVTVQELENQAQVMQARDSGAFGQGMARAGRGLKASAAEYYGLGNEALGNTVAATGSYDDAARQRELGQLAAPNVPTWESAQSLGDYSRFAAGAMGNGIVSMGPTMAAALAARTLPISAGARFGAAIVPSVVPMAGETAHALNTDPVAKNLTASERFALSTGGGLGGAAAEALVPHVLAGGIGAKNFVPKLVGAHVGEGVSEVASSDVNRAIVGSANPNRDTSQDMANRKEEFLGGFFGAAPVATPGAIAGQLMSTTQAVGGGLNETAKDIAGAAVAAVDNVKALDAQTTGEAVGKAATAVREGAENLKEYLKNRSVKGANAELDHLLSPQKQQAGSVVDPFDWMAQDDAARNASANTLAAKYIDDPETPAYVKQAALAKLQNNNTDAWVDFGGVARKHEMDVKKNNTIKTLQASFEEAGVKAGKLASDIKGGFEEGRKQNAQSTDPFDDLFTKTLFGLTNGKNSGDPTGRLVQLAAASPYIKEWISNGFSATKDGALFVPKQFGSLMKDPAAGISTLHDLMNRQGILSDTARERLPEVLKVLAGHEDNASVVEASLLPTAQEEHKFSGADHKTIATKIERMIKTGKIDDASLDHLFGHNKEKVLAAIESTMDLKRGERQKDENVIKESDGSNPDDAEQASANDDISSMTNEIAPNTVGSNVSWKGPYDVTAEGAKAGHDAAVKKALGQNKDVKNVGVIDHLREVHASDPVARERAIVDLISKHKDSLSLEERAHPDVALNNKLRMVREAEASDKHDAIDIKGSEFDSLSGKLGSSTNKWAMSEGKNKEHGGPENGRLWFRRAGESVDKESGEITRKGHTAKEFNTSSALIISRMRQAMKDVGGERKSGVLDQKDMLLQGISSMLNATDAEGHHALTGEVGIMRGGKIKWVGKDFTLPNDFKLASGTMKDVHEEEHRVVAAANNKELRAWLEKNNNPMWTKEDAEDLKRVQAANDAGVKNGRMLKRMLTRKELADVSREAREALRAKDDARIADVLNRAVDDSGAYSTMSAKSESVHIKIEDPLIDPQGIKVDGHVTDNKTSTSKRGHKLADYGDEQGAPYSEHANKYIVDTPSEELRNIERANAELEAKERVYDETTGEELHPRESKKRYPVPNEQNMKLGPEWDHAEPNAKFDEQAKADLAARRAAEMKNSQQPTMKNSTQATPEELAKATEVITKSLGENFPHEFVNSLGGHSADWAPNVIRIATNAVGGVVSNAYHESMHEFFDRIVNGKQSDVARLLLDATNSPAVKRSLARILAEHPAALASMEKDPSEALAYAYQFWADGHPMMKLGPKAESFFEKVAKFFRKVTGLLRDDEKAEALFRDFKDGKLQEVSVAGEVLAKLNNNAKRVEAVAKTVEPFRRNVADWIGSAEDNMLLHKDTTVQELGKLYADHNDGYIQATDRSEKQWLGKLKAALLPHDKEDISAALEGLQTGVLSNDAKIRAVQKDVRKVLEEMHPWLQQAGVSAFDEESKQWQPLGKLENYFPRSWSAEALHERGPEFVARLKEVHMAALEAIATKANEEVAAGVSAGELTASDTIKHRLITADDIADAIYNRLASTNGQADLNEASYSLGFSPNMRAVNKRTLDWIDMTRFHDYQNKDLVNILSSYVMQATKRAEYTRRFGPSGEVVQEAMDKAQRNAVERIIKDNPNMTQEEAKAQATKELAPVQRSIMAMEGTLGHDINPTLRKAQGWVLAYQNWRMLPMALFSNLIDPLGILVRGGEMNDAFKAYKNAMSDVINSWRGKDREDNLTQLAEAIGTLDAQGYMNSMGTMMNSMYMSGGAKHMNDMLFRINGMEALNRSMRGSATQAAIGFIKRHATSPNSHSERLLKELNLDADYVKTKISDAGVPGAQGLDVTDPRIQNAIAQWVNEAILRPTSAQRPSRGSDPHYALFMHFKGFMFAMKKQILDRASREARLGNYTAVSTLALGYIPVMYAADMVKLIVQNGIAGNAGMPPWWNAMDAKDHALYAAQRAGLSGPSQVLFDAAEYGPAAALGPTAEQIVGAVSEPVEKTAVGALPWNQVFASAQRSVHE